MKLTVNMTKTSIAARDAQASAAILGDARRGATSPGRIKCSVIFTLVAGLPRQGFESCGAQPLDNILNSS